VQSVQAVRRVHGATPVQAGEQTHRPPIPPPAPTPEAPATPVAAPAEATAINPAAPRPP
jgi:hypothetical protein